MHTISSTWAELLGHVFQMFTKSGAEIFLRLMTGWVMCTTGRKINGTGCWRNAILSTKKSIAYAWGLNLVVLTLQVQSPCGGETLGLPINMRLQRKMQEKLIELATRRKTKRFRRPRTQGKKLPKLEKMAAHIQTWKTVIFSRRGTMLERLVYTHAAL